MAFLARLPILLLTGLILVAGAMPAVMTGTAHPAFAQDDEIARRDEGAGEEVVTVQDDDDDDTGDTGGDATVDDTNSADGTAGTDGTNGTDGTDGGADTLDGDDSSDDDRLDDDRVSDCGPDDDGSEYCDVADGYVHQRSIQEVSDAGIASGFANGSFQPGDDVSRAQLAAFIQRAFDLDPGDGDDGFRDTDGNVHQAAIAAAVKAGIVTGYPDGTYRPDADVSRAQLATFIARVLELEAGDGDDGFRDTDGGVHEPWIAAAVEAGIVTGYPDGTYRPDADVSRGQMATFLAQALRL